MTSKIEASYAPYTYILEKESFSQKVKRYFRNLRKHANRKYQLMRKALLKNLFKPNYLHEPQIPYDIRRAINDLTFAGASANACTSKSMQNYQLNISSTLPREELEELVSFFNGRGWNVEISIVTTKSHPFGKTSTHLVAVSDISTITTLKENQQIQLGLSKESDKH